MRTLLTTLHSKFIHPSLALPCLAAYCGEDGGEILIREFTLHEPKENILAALLREEPDVVAFSVYLWNRQATLELVAALAAARPELRLVLGGPEVSFEDENFLRLHPGVAAVVRGEGEIPLRALLRAWHWGESPAGIARLLWRDGERFVNEADGPVLDHLDDIPSPFELGLVDISRGFVYTETSRGCPYSCAFCMSALDEKVRSFSMARIRADLGWLMAREVPRIKLVDRTFNYDAARSREIFRFILEHNRGSHFHFEIGAHLLDEETLALLAQVPPGTFQFEIGVQSTLPQALSAIGRQVSLQKLEENVRALRRHTPIDLHLDLIAGLPGEGYDDFLHSIDRVLDLHPHELQVELVKLLPGSPLRRQAAARGIAFDPHPPYTVLRTPELSFQQLETLRGISRLLDLTANSCRFGHFLDNLQEACGNLSAGLEKIEAYWQARELFRHPLSQRGLFEKMGEFVTDSFEGPEQNRLREELARDFALTERVVPEKAPAFFDTALSAAESARVRERVQAETAAVKGQGVKVQHFAAAFDHLPDFPARTLMLYLYLTRTGQGLEVREIPLSS
ncbi:DUF4080 domain-containing protein [Desulfuromonas sp. KJ2020]|uniref:B12-binding domain-containing radical SAM protein n=1 Tax=Desulfuromonas sp. KJ2020 TaxID=2919173 RepID=UPI0020A81597|nr:B12-binding domain-containing radical SAM protein [Desulfuromonas sp. KJ2020]MCP3176978.1 DUF4080 domain-containing protein [Desulfuromonas sp. KJ2020]